ncbi:restriction endonuclease subunit S [Acinetobacter sp.]|uniref:restriction endonuclease subunit S n=1 Tax=Acinetobacter sp. TaxID=472 RepID=UPI00333F58C8
MSEWVSKKIGDIANLYQGLAINAKTKHLLVTESSLPLLRIKDLLEGTKEQFVDPKLAPLQCVVEPNELVMTRTGQVGYVFMGKSGVLHNNCFKITVTDPEVDTRFLYWHFNSNAQRDYLTTIAAGSVQPDLNHKVFKDYDILLPPFPEQKAIASVLSSLDNKIDLLHRQNKTLEAMAETLFRQWFIEEASENGVQGTLKDELLFTMGQSPSGTSFNEEAIGTPMFQGNADFGFRFPSERVYTTEPTRFAKPLDTLISVRAPVGAQNMARVKCCIGRGVAAFRHAKHPEWYTYTYYKLNHLMAQIKKFNDEGTVFGSISKSDFEKLEIVIPNDDAIRSFEEIAQPINDKIIVNTNQIEKLEQLRDTLLPKLMSGEVRVQYQSEQVA